MADLIKSPGEGVTEGAIETWTACNNADQEYLWARGDILQVRNTGAGAHNFTVYSAPEAHTGRVLHITESIAAGQTRRYGPFPADGWRQANGKLKIKGVHAELLTSMLPGKVGHVPAP
jgi:hypothetical protein